MKLLPITIEMDGLGEIKQLVMTAQDQANELMQTVEKINLYRIELQMRINQPTDGTDG